MARTRDKLIELAERLIAATEQGMVEWQESDRPHAYQYSSGASTAVIATEDDDGAAPYELEIRDSDGVVVESLASQFFRVEGQKQRRAAPWNKVLIELYETARGDAHNVNVVLDDLLDGLPPRPEPDDVPF